MTTTPFRAYIVACYHPSEETVVNDLTAKYVSIISVKEEPVLDDLHHCDFCVFLNPTGQLAHFTLGLAIGMGKKTAVLFEDGYEEAPYHYAQCATNSLPVLLEWCAEQCVDPFDDEGDA